MKRRYQLPETVSIWLCNFSILKSKDVFKDTWTVYSENDIRSDSALPIFPKNKCIIVDLPKFAKIRKGVKSHEDFWLKLLLEGPLDFGDVDDPLFVKALDRLRVSNAKPELLKVMEENMFDEKHTYEAIIAEAQLKARAEGEANANQKAETRDKKIA